MYICLCHHHHISQRVSTVEYNPLQTFSCFCWMQNQSVCLHPHRRTGLTGWLSQFVYVTSGQSYAALYLCIIMKSLSKTITLLAYGSYKAGCAAAGCGMAVMNGQLEAMPKVTLRMKNRRIAVIENSLCNIRLAISERSPAAVLQGAHFSLCLTILFLTPQILPFFLWRPQPLAISLS